MFVQWQNCTLGGQDVSYETQSKSVFRIKANVKNTKNPNNDIEKAHTGNKIKLKKIPKLTFCLKTLEKKHLYKNRKRKRKCYLISLFETITKHDLI